MDKPFLKTYPASLLIKITKIVLTYYFGYCYHLFSTYHMPLVWPVARELTQETTEIFLPPVQLMGFSVAGSPPPPPQPRATPTGHSLHGVLRFSWKMGSRN